MTIFLNGCASVILFAAVADTAYRAYKWNAARVNRIAALRRLGLG